MSLTKISTAINLPRLSLTLGIALIIPLFSSVNNSPLWAQTIVAENQNLQDETQYSQIIYVDPRTGNDQNGQGSQQSPLKTITQALMIAQPKSLIILNSGTYNEQSGENFPLVIKQEVTIQGNPKLQGRNIKIEGNGFFVSPTAAGQNVTIALMNKAAGVMGVTVTNLHQRGHGIWIESANPILHGNTLVRNGNTGVSVNGNSAPVISNNYFYNNTGNGVLVYGTSKPRVENNEFHRTGYGVSAVQNSAPTLIGNTFRDNRIGVMLEGNSSATLRNNIITNSTEIGLMTISQANADLGHSNDAGGNIFRSNRQLDLKNSSKNQVITAFGNQINGKTSGNIDLKGNVAPTQVASSPYNVTPSNPSTPLTNNNSATVSSSPATGQVIEVTAPTANQSPSLSSSPASLNQRNNFQPPVKSTSTNNSPPSPTNSNSNPNIPPLPTKTPATEVIRINGSSTPASPVSSGKTVASNRTLPAPPEISEPYRRNNQNNTTQTASSTTNPFNNSGNARVISMNQSRQNNTSPSTSSNNSNPNQTKPVTSPPSTRYSNSNQTRRSLADILVVAPSASNSPSPSGFTSNNNSSSYSAYNSRNTSTVYKVVVPAKYGYQESQIRSLYPDAFRTTYNGQTMLQVGVFSTQDRANQVVQSLHNLGLTPLIIR